MVVLGRAVPLLIISIALYTFSTVTTGNSLSYKFEDDVSESDSTADLKVQKQDVAVNTAIRSDVVKKQWVWEGDLVGDALPKGMEKDEFIALLKQRFYGSYILFGRLDVADQELIYIGYKADSEPDINDIRKAILKHKS